LITLDEQIDGTYIQFKDDDGKAQHYHKVAEAEEVQEGDGTARMQSIRVVRVMYMGVSPDKKDEEEVSNETEETEILAVDEEHDPTEFHQRILFDEAFREFDQAILDLLLRNSHLASIPEESEERMGEPSTPSPVIPAALPLPGKEEDEKKELIQALVQIYRERREHKILLQSLQSFTALEQLQLLRNAL